jgi:hypothetical protein
MFRWVEIWLDLMIPETIVPGKAVQSERVASGLLEGLEKDATPMAKFDPEEQLPKAYKRLWDLNSTLDSEFAENDSDSGQNVRKRLFQLIALRNTPKMSKTCLRSFRVGAMLMRIIPHPTL